MTTAYELRHHLQRAHGINLAGANWATLQKEHSVEHRPGKTQNHTHGDGPNVGEWESDCAEFGCSDEAH